MHNWKWFKIILRSNIFWRHLRTLFKKLDNFFFRFVAATPTSWHCRCQFHQHFYEQLFHTKVEYSYSVLLTVWLCNFLAKEYWRSKDSSKMLLTLTTGVDFTNILCKAFKSEDPKRVKIQSSCHFLFVLLWSLCAKVARKMLVKLTTGVAAIAFPLSPSASSASTSLDGLCFRQRLRFRRSKTKSAQTVDQLRRHASHPFQRSDG